MCGTIAVFTASARLRGFGNERSGTNTVENRMTSEHVTGREDASEPDDGPNSMRHDEVSLRRDDVASRGFGDVEHVVLAEVSFNAKFARGLRLSAARCRGRE